MSTADRRAPFQTEMSVHKHQFEGEEWICPKSAQSEHPHQKLDFLSQLRAGHHGHFVVQKRQIEVSSLAKRERLLRIVSGDHTEPAFYRAHWSANGWIWDCRLRQSTVVLFSITSLRSFPKNGNHTRSCE